MARNTQNEMILEHLMKGRSITPLEALSLYGSLRLGARIYDIERRGIRVRRERAAGHRYFIYWIDPGEIERVKREREKGAAA